ncbi:MAG: tRNA (5-methylaminomethyl-2-thiouridine)(34)-methyltransferase MnmD, partial [Pseudomonadales bacterium]
AGLAEKHHVFIEGNHLATRFKGNHRTHFTMLEVGFGFGLNFLLTAKTWRASAPQQSILNYIAIEKTPVAPADLARLYAALARAEGFNERHATQLLHHYPTPYPGTHTIWVAEDIALTLVIGDLKDVLGDIDASADAWFLDGFSPARNADAWTRELFSAMPRMSQPGATFSTYSVAGEVRRGLASAGFEVRRSPGFGTKAEMLSGVLPGTWQAQTLGSGRIAVIGAGIAGLNCARALARRHLDVTVYDQAGALAGASSIPGLAMSPHLAVRPHVGSLFSLAALQYATRFSDEVHVTGRFTLASNETDETRLQRIGDTFPDSIARYLNAREAGRLPGMNACGPGLYFAPGGWLEPAILARKVRVTAKQVTGMTTGASPRLQFADGQIEDFDGIIIATGAGPLPQTAPLSFEPVRGQAIQVLAPG